MIQTIAHTYDLTPLQAGYADFVRRWTAEDEAEFNDGRLHASGLGLCKRQQVLKANGFNGRPLTEEDLITFAEANFIHAGMTNFWMRNGTAIAREQRFDDLPVEMHVEKLEDRLSSPFPGWTGKFDALVHRPEWCGCNEPSKKLAGVWDTMVRMFNRQDEDWTIYRDIIRTHEIIPCSLKTVHPNGLRHYVHGPKPHNVWQDSWYVAAANKAYDLSWDKILLMYRGRGGGGRPIFHLVQALDTVQIIAEYNAALASFTEDRELPDVMDLSADFETDKTYGEAIRLETSWQCGYCSFSGWTDKDGGFNCTPKPTKNKGSDRIAVIQGDKAVIVEQWCYKADYDLEYVDGLVKALIQSENRNLDVTYVKTDRQLEK